MIIRADRATIVCGWRQADRFAIIAEGHSRPSRQDYRHYLSMARGETGELDTNLRAIAEDYPHVVRETDVALALVDEISRMLMAMIKKLQ
jgi:four helix bundle protein